VGGEKPGFSEILCCHPKSRKKPGFFELNEVARNRVFLEILCDRPKSRKKPGFFELNEVARNRVFPKYFVVILNLVKNPVSGNSTKWS